jgi:hypothetical protein
MGAWEAIGTLDLIADLSLSALLGRFCCLGQHPEAQLGSPRRRRSENPGFAAGGSTGASNDPRAAAYLRMAAAPRGHRHGAPQRRSAAEHPGACQSDSLL